MQFINQIIQKKAPAISITAEEQVIRALSDCLQIVEVEDASPFVGELFQRRFVAQVPDFPRHFVALYSDNQKHWQALGYVHQTEHKGSYLCGGLVMDNFLYRHVKAQHRQRIAQAGGVAELLLRRSFALLGDCDAIWGYVGDKQARKVDLRVGFEATEHPYLMVVWRRPFSTKKKAAMIQEFIQLGAF